MVGRGAIVIRRQGVQNPSSLLQPDITSEFLFQFRESAWGASLLQQSSFARCRAPRLRSNWCFCGEDELLFSWCLRGGRELGWQTCLCFSLGAPPVTKRPPLLPACAVGWPLYNPAR